ncbi:hypothetical protein [Kibdelosporangium phytohabitans]|uniref:hypothetical protein n=1 Tax=Kibdelosporangium phytohabitans TaxID=860235 RepID=UPI0017895F3B|nr:hypothetical protein [Kibdelosporangium phytohabitans]MBE1462130.1 hypothetical protein [Kibdelosporangium phytohabitans]
MSIRVVPRAVKKWSPGRMSRSNPALVSARHGSIRSGAASVSFSPRECPDRHGQRLGVRDRARADDLEVRADGRQEQVEQVRVVEHH